MATTAHTSVPKNNPKKVQKARTGNTRAARAARADFSEGTRNMISKAAGYRCCNPSCRQNLFINNKVIGQVAHIIAASAKGPRASNNFEKERGMIKSSSNGLLLCHNCAILVDANDQVYNVDLLREWKIKGESVGIFQAHKCMILKELENMEQLMLSYDSSIKRERDDLGHYEDRIENELDIINEELNACKLEKEQLIKTVDELRQELAIKDQYIMNIIQAKLK